MTDFSTLLRVLDDHDVAYILVGGAAATVHGSARLTLDVDVVYQRTPDNLARVVNALAPYQPVEEVCSLSPPAQAAWR